MVKSKKFNIIKSFKFSKNFKLGLTFNPIFFSDFVTKNQKTLIYVYSRNKYFSNKFKPTCMITGRQRGILSNFFISRIIFKKYAINYQITGFKKSRW